MVITTARADRSIARPRLRTSLILIAAVVVAVAANAVVARLAVAAGAPATYGPLTFPAYTLFTALGIVVGWIGWSLVRRRARDPRRTLSMLVPVVTLASFIPDLLLLLLRFIPGTTVSAVIGLMVMHVVVVAVAVPAYVWASREAS
ncbi:DUF6069 family protein [Microbacterium sp. 3J1]|uniref:DUF6069 family protein n=1 Tax=Microbacterium sp. 3J1 TaxID=861269 RepID=UPI000B0FC3CE|nr:DUF6069 family protein [Microbacterium sp. 3J1]